MTSVEEHSISVPNVPDWPDTRTPSQYFDSIRFSRAASLRYPSASNFSKSLTFSKYNLMNFRDSLETLELAETDHYNLSHFLESGAVDCTGEVMEKHENICDWIRRNIFVRCGRTVRNNLRAKSEERLLLGEDPQAPPLETSTCKFPDVGIYYYERSRHFCLLQFEVDSGGYESTVIKLAHGLADQLVWQRNRSDAITACSGLYFPTFSRGQCVVAIQLEWTDSRLAFHVSRSVLPLIGLQDSIVQLIHAEVAKVPAFLAATALTHRLPLTQAYVTETFGAGAYQLNSGESIVIVNRLKREVYKFPLLAEYALRLLELLSMKIPSTQFLLPHTRFPTRQRFFVCRLLKPPLKAQEVKGVLTVYLRSVVAALTELHGHNLAHLDVRLENICFDEANRAVFIDLDRSEQADSSVSFKRKSLMYTYFESWTYKQWDWRQLGLLLVRVLQPVSSAEEYHTKEPDFRNPSLEHAFLRTLYHDGKNSVMQT